MATQINRYIPVDIL